MDEEILKQSWKQIKPVIKDSWREFSDDELEQIHGDKDSLLRKLRTKYGYSKKFAEESLDRVLDKVEKKEDEEPSVF